MSAPDCILSVHLNPLTCGVAKFNVQLAERLGVPCLRLDAQPFAYPLISIKTAEDRDEWAEVVCWYRQCDLLLHDLPRGLCADSAVRNATRVYAANETIAADVRRLRADVIVCGCPATLHGNATRGTLNVLSFGMAHKYQAHHFERLAQLLDETPDTYTVSVSTGIHEGSPWDETFTANMALMRGVFGDHLRALGFLADDALAKELREVQAVALFFDPAARANNTSLWAALEAGTPVITNLDQDSPPELQHGVSVFDLAHLTEWPDAAACRVVRAGGRKAAEAYSWERLIATLTAPVTV